MIVPIVIGFLLLAILLYWFLRGKESDGCRVDFSQVQAALNHLQSGISSSDLIERIANEQDMIFIRSEGNPDLTSLFDRERRTLAMLWLRRTNEHVKLLMNFHVKSARLSVTLGPAIELKLAFQFLVFALIFRGLLVIVWLRGPFHSRKVAGSIASTMKNLCTISQQVLTMKTPPEAGSGSPVGG